MEALIRKKSMLMSLFMGLCMGVVFTIASQLKQMGRIMPMGLLIGVLVSMTISAIIGLIVPMKKVNEGVCKILKIPQSAEFKVLLASALMGDLIFTPLNCGVNMWIGMSMGLQDVPPDVTNIFQRMMFCASLPHFVPALITTLLMDLVIGYVLCVAVTKPVTKLVDHILGF